MKRQRATKVLESANHVLVRSASGAGYWGRGETVKEAISNAKWLGSQDSVYIMACTPNADCNPVSGGIRGHQGDIYVGKVMAKRDDVMVTEVADFN